MFPFKEEGMELAAEQEMIRCVSHITMQEPLQQHIALFLNKIINTNDRSLWDSYLKPLNDYLSELNLTQFIFSARSIMQIYSTIKAYFDDKKFVWSDAVSSKIGMYYDFLNLMNFLLIKTIVTNQNFATIDAQTALFDELTHQIPHTHYWGKPSQDVLFAWVYILSELQKTQELPATLKPLEQKLPLSRIVSCFFEKPVDYYRYLKHLEVLKQPLYDFYQSGLPLDVIGKEYFDCSKNGAIIYKAGVPALWPLKVLDSLNSMPESQKKLWLQVWQHAAANNTTLLPSDDWLQGYGLLVLEM